jgi:hypothetical protein
MMNTQRRKPGRPKLAPEVAQLAIKLPRPLLRRIDSVASDEFCRRSDMVRALLESALLGRGVARCARR